MSSSHSGLELRLHFGTAGGRAGHRVTRHRGPLQVEQTLVDTPAESSLMPPGAPGPRAPLLSGPARPRAKPRRCPSSGVWAPPAPGSSHACTSLGRCPGSSDRPWRSKAGPTSRSFLLCGLSTVLCCDVLNQGILKEGRLEGHSPPRGRDALCSRSSPRRALEGDTLSPHPRPPSGGHSCCPGRRLPPRLNEGTTSPGCCLEEPVRLR